MRNQNGNNSFVGYYYIFQNAHLYFVPALYTQDARSYEYFLLF